MSMKLMFATTMRVAAVMTLSVVAFAQAAQQAPAEPQTGSAASAQTKAGATAPAAQMTLVGCVQREADYRRAQDAGKGGVAGTGIGAGNEFVLINASTAPAAGSPAATSGTAAGTPTGTGGSTGTAYELTGPNERQAEQYVGKRVEIMGMLKPAETGAAGPTGGPTAGAPPKGVDVTSQDLKLREMEVSSVKEVPGACPAATK
jgi:hypothetical protein